MLANISESIGAAFLTSLPQSQRLPAALPSPGSQPAPLYTAADSASIPQTQAHPTVFPAGEAPHLGATLSFLQNAALGLIDLIAPLVSVMSSLLQILSPHPAAAQAQQTPETADKNTGQEDLPAASSASASVSTDNSAHETPNQNFLWKPVSDSDQHLVILCPARQTGKVSRVEVLSPAKSEILAKGRYTGTGNGDREHYRFDKPGASFPRGCWVQITMEDKSVNLIKIKKPGQRFQKYGT